MLIVSGTMRMAPEVMPDFLAAAAEVSRATRLEAGCLAYHFSADELEEGLAHVYEQWTDKAALDAHLQLEHVTTFRRALTGLGERTSDVAMYEATELGRPEVPPLQG